MEGTHPRPKTRATVRGVHPAELRGDIHEDMLSRQDETRLEGNGAARRTQRYSTTQQSIIRRGRGGEGQGVSIALHRGRKSSSRKFTGARN